MVTTPQKVALDDAQKGMGMFRQPQINVPVLGVVENMAYFSPLDMPEKKYYIFGKDGGRNFADKYEVPLLGQIPIVESIRESGDSGTPDNINSPQSKEAFTNLAEGVARQIAIRNATMEKTKPVEVN
jgi:ATP-binding protein involved in chromosome partitioning